ncbi:MAG: YIP1 family protein [Chthoniobacterales bacterium]|nr:YIP1 family protein [Chthoniobacterales bacterium]
MSLIHVARHGQTVGIFNEEDLREEINQQRLYAEDLIWKQGMIDWRPLHEMTQEWGWDVLTLKTMKNDSPLPPLLVPLPWEELGTRNFFSAFFNTLRAVLFSPKITFSRLDTKGGFIAPLLFYVLTASTIFTATLLMLLPQVLKNPSTFSPQLATLSQKSIIIGFVGLLVLAPFIFIAGVFLSSSIAHLSLKILGVARRPFRATLRIVCYSFGSTACFQLIPFVGSILGAVWGLVLYSIGLKEVYTLSKWRTFFVILLSIAFYLVLVMLVAFIFAAFYTGGAMPPAAPAPPSP